MTTPAPRTSLTDSELHALVDGQLPASERAALEQRLAHDPQGQVTQARWTAQRAQLRALHDHVLEEPLPKPLLDAARQLDAVQKRNQHLWHLGGMAAGVLLAFGAGWLGHSTWQDSGGLSVARIAATPSVEFARQARFAHVVYVPEVRHPVEVAATERDHLVQWLSKRLGRSLKVPDLSVQGYTLVGGRLLPGDTGARAQFMFQNTTGTRVTLYLGALAASTNGAVRREETSPRETAFRFASDAGVPSFYWVDGDFGYALSGSLDHAALLALANTVYHQL